MLGLQSNLSKSKGIKSYNSTNSMRFIPNNDFVKISDHADFNHVRDSISRFTVSLWFKHDDGTPTDKETLIAKYDVNSNKREWRISIDDNKKIEVFISSDGNANITNVSTYVVDDTDWHHLYFRYDGSQTTEEHRAYMVVDGVNVLGSGAGTPSASNYAQLYEGDADLTIGCFLNNGVPNTDAGFDGRIDEVCYWKGHYYKTSSQLAAEYIYNNGNPRDMRYAGGGNSAFCEHIGYWKMGEFYNGGAAVPDGTFPMSTTNPKGTTGYSGGNGGRPFVCLNYAGGSPKKTGSNLVRNGDFSTAITECAVDEANNGATHTSGTDWNAGHGSNTGHTVTNDTSIYYTGGRSIKITVNSDGDNVYMKQTTDTNLVDGEFYVFEFWWRTDTDSSNSGSQSWGRCAYHVVQCIEKDAQYGLSGDSSDVSIYSTINKWHRVIQVGKYNAGSNNNEIVELKRHNGNITALAKTFWFDNISLWKLTGSHHGVFVSAGTVDAMVEGVDR